MGRGENLSDKKRNVFVLLAVALKRSFPRPKLKYSLSFEVNPSHVFGGVSEVFFIEALLLFKKKRETSNRKRAFINYRAS